MGDQWNNFGATKQQAATKNNQYGKTVKGAGAPP
jgi:hypothetical protein